MERKLAVILAADVVGYSKLMEDDEAGTYSTLSSLINEFIIPVITRHKGRVVKLMGDGILAEFGSVIEALECAIHWQRQMPEKDSSGKLQFRIGINLGEIIIEDDDIFGNGVNIAARLEASADPGGICISDDVYRQTKGKIEVTFEDMGEQKFKNVEEPVRAYRITDRIAVRELDQPEEAKLALPDKPSIAVLPFTNMSADSAQEFLSDGISEDIITALSKLSKLFVVARNSTFTYKGRAVDIKQVGREQGVRYVLEGSVRSGGDRLRITAQLIDATTGLHLWAQRYDRVVEDVFALQDEITREVTSALQVELTEGEEARLWASGTQNLEAWEAAIQIPELFYSHRRENALKGRSLAEQALQLDEHYATAWTFLGWSHWLEAFAGWSDDPDTSLELALDAATHALSIDESEPVTLAMLAYIHLSLRKYKEAFDFGERALVLGPNNSFVALAASNVALFCNKPHDMLVLVKKAMRLCPIYPAVYAGDLTWANLLMDRREDVIITAQDAINLDPDYVVTYTILAIAYAELEQEQEAQDAASNILRIEPKFSIRTFAESQPFQDKDVLGRHIEGLRKAGLPE